MMNIFETCIREVLRRPQPIRRAQRKRTNSGLASDCAHERRRQERCNMQLFDPNRPQVNFRPGLLTDGPGAIVPQLQLFPKPDGTIDVSCMLPIKAGRFTAKAFHRTLHITSIQAMLEDFISDPEATLKWLFHDEIQKWIDTNMDLVPNLEPSNKAFGRDLRKQRERDERREQGSKELVL
jgi:hypothetical protein